MKKILIFGSCVSRDALEYAEPGQFKIVGYYARSSLASLATPPKLDKEILGEIASKFQQKMVEADMDKTFWRVLDETKFDIFLMDFIDERFHLLEKSDGSCHTISTEYKKASKKILLGRQIANWSDRKFELWTKSFAKIVAKLTNKKIIDKLIINKVFWSKKNNFGNPISGYLPEQIDRANFFLARLYSEAEKFLPGSCFISYPENILYCDSGHKWGISPFHYNDLFYKLTISHLREVNKPEILKFYKKLDMKIFIGFTRFSIFSKGSNAWILSQKDDYLKNLFDAKRIESRINIFFDVSLPLLNHNYDINNNYRHFVFYSDLLPENFKREILDRSSDYNFLIPFEVSSDINFSFHDHFQEYLNGFEHSFKKIGIFSLDDDDLLPVDYLSKAVEYLQDCYVGKIVSFGAGFTGFYKDGKFSNIKSVYHPKINIGMLSICDFKNSKLNCPRKGTHTYADKLTPVILDSRIPMFFWTRHENQDTAHNKNNATLLREIDTLEDFDEYKVLLKNRFPSLFELLKKSEVIETLIIEKPINELKNRIFSTKAKGNLNLKVFISCDNAPDKKSTLISFFPPELCDFIDGDDVRGAGLLLSSNKAIGAYRYLNTISGSKNYYSIISLNIRFDGFRLKFVDYKSSNTFIHKIEIHQS